MKFANFALIVGLLLICSISHGTKIQESIVEYKEGDTVLEGYLARPIGNRKKKPGVLVVHAWKGLNDYAKRRARMLAEMGYVAFAADIYGKGVRPQTSEEAGKLSSQYKSDVTLLRKRVNAAFEQLKKSADVNPDKVAAIGYCFGGTTVLELARSGTPLAGVVSFHGGLSTPKADDAKNIKAKVLVLHGADDPLVPNKEVEAFAKEMRDANVDWQMVSYGGAVHSFTELEAGNDPKSPARYNKAADERSWMAMQLFFKEIL